MPSLSNMSADLLLNCKLAAPPNLLPRLDVPRLRQAEYSTVVLTAELSSRLPVVALCDGIWMGLGFGIAGFCRHRCGLERAPGHQLPCMPTGSATGGLATWQVHANCTAVLQASDEGLLLLAHALVSHAKST
jgi:hypothetical protein